MFTDSFGKQIAGYRYGVYWFNAGKKISAFCNVKYSSECQLVQDWDAVNGSHSESPKLIRVYADGEERQLRPLQEAS